jgi:hypothetical protein
VRRLSFFAILVCGAGSLLFDLTLGARLPSEADWAEAAGALRARGQPGDAVQLWPVWAEEARLHVDSMPVLAEEDLAHADYLGVKRLWLLTLPHTPWFKAPSLANASPAGPELRYGAIRLQPFQLNRPESWPLTPQDQEHEVDYVARHCNAVRIGSRFVARGPAGSMLHLRAGVIGEEAYKPGRPPVVVRAFADGAPLGVLEVPRTEKDGTGYRRLDVPVPEGAAEREFSFSIESPDMNRPFCLAAWTSK